ncbi:MAG: tryptophan 7-halogenase [Myxococcota bacterium]
MSAPHDVAILGGGIAATLLARQLRKRIPEARIVLFENGAGRRGGKPEPKVGESTVEIASHYLLSRQQLSGYLYEHHLPKNGLRFFFDTPGRDTPLTEMSEIGTINLPFHQAFQLDRARMEPDLLEMCRAEGIDVRLGATVKGVALSDTDAPHRVTVTAAGADAVFDARWVVDATGRRGLLAHQEGLRRPEPDHQIGSVWGRFEGVTDIDQLGDEAFRARVRHTTRGLSTVHFLHPGYWVWVIRLRGGLTSIGVVGTPTRDAKLRTADGFRAFLDEHAALRTLLADAKAVDHGSMARIAYGTEKFLSPQRWGMIGEAATATDPFYSPGLDFVALENDFLTDLVARDLGGEEASSWAESLALYDRFLEFRHQAVMRLYRGLYPIFGSYDLMRLKWDFDIASYHNLWVSPYLQGLHLDAAWLKRQLRLEGFVLQAMDHFAALFRRVEEKLRDDDAYYQKNRGVFSYGLENIPFLPEIGTPRSQRTTLKQAQETFNIVRRDALRLLDDPAAEEPWSLQSFATRPLA